MTRVRILGLCSLLVALAALRVPAYGAPDDAAAPRAETDDAVLEGDVLDQAGLPVAGVRVVVREDEQPLFFHSARVTRDAIDRAYRAPRSLEGDSPLARVATTDAQGRFRIEGLRSRTRFHVRACPVSPLYGDSARPTTRAGEPRRVSLRVLPGRILRGRVVDTAGQGLPAWVRAEAHSGPDRWLDSPWPVRRFLEPAHETDADGRFRLVVPPESKILLGARLPGVVFAPTLVRVASTADEVALVLPPTGAASVIGSVRDEDGHPVEGARVVAIATTGIRDLPHARRVVLARSDAAGRFEVPHLPATELVALAVEAPGFVVWHRIAKAAPLLAERPLEVGVVLVRGVRIQVRVRTPAAQPVAGADVMLLGRKHPASSASWARRARTATDGIATFDEVPPGKGHVLAEADGYFQQVAIPRQYGVELRGPSFDTRAPESDALVDVVLQPGVTLHGRVIDRKGAPVPAATVSLDLRRREGLGWAGFTSPRCSTDEDGRFSVRGLPPNAALTVRALHPSYTHLVTTVVSPRTADDAPVTLIMDRGATVAGRLLDGRDRPLSGFRVTCAGGGTAQVTNAYGHFAFTNVRTGRSAVVSVGHSTQPGTSARLELEPGQVVDDLVLRYTGTHTLAGRVVDHEGHPLANRAVTVRMGTGGTVGTTQVWTRADGTFHLSHVPPGRAVLWCGRASADVDVPRANESTLQLTLPPPPPSFVLHGSVVGPDDAAVDQATVRLVFPDDGRNVARAEGIALGGRFRLRVPGPRRPVVLHVERAIDARGRDLDVVPARLELPEPGDAAVLVELKRASPIRGVVVDEDGEPARRIVVRLTPERNGKAQGAVTAATTQATTDDQGRFHFRGLTQGNYHITLGPGGSWMMRERVRVPAGSENVRIHLLALLDLELIVRGPDERPLPGCEVHLWDRTRTPPRWLENRTTDAAGMARWIRLRPNVPLTLSVKPPPGEGELADLMGTTKEHVLAGTAVEVRLEKGVCVAGRVLDEAGTPVVGATVRLHAESPPRRLTLTTDADGSYRFRRLPPDRLVRVEADGPPDASPRYFSASAVDVATGRENVDLVLERGVSIEGRIEGVPAAALEGATIQVSPLIRGGARGRYAFDGSTTAFEVSDLPRGAYTVGVQGGRMLVHEKPRTLTAPARGVVFRARRCYLFSGALMGAAGEVFTVEFHAPGLEPRSERAGSDGLFRFRSMPDAHGMLLVWRRGDDRLALVENLHTGRRDPLIVELVRGKPIRGTVVGQTKPLAQGRVIARRGSIAMEGTVAEDGQFETPPLPPGTWTLHFSFRYPVDGGVPPTEPLAAGSDGVVVTWDSTYD